MEVALKYWLGRREQNASAANDSGDWGGWGSGVGAAAKPADQDNSWEVHAKVQDNLTCHFHLP